MTAIPAKPEAVGTRQRRAVVTGIRPEEIAGTVAFLLSDDAAAITGQNLVVCSGASL